MDGSVGTDPTEDAAAALGPDAASMSPGGGAVGGGGMDAGGSGAGGSDTPGSAVGSSAFGSAPYARIQAPVRRLLLAGSDFCVVLADRSLHCGDAERPGDYGYAPPRGAANADFDVVIKPTNGQDLLGIRRDGSVISWEWLFQSVDELSPEGTGHISAARNEDTVCGLRATGELNCQGAALSAEIMAGRYVQITLTNRDFVGLGVDGRLYASALSEGSSLRILYEMDDRQFVSFDHGARPGCGVDTAGELHCLSGGDGQWGGYPSLYSNVMDYSLFAGTLGVIRADGKIEFRFADGRDSPLEVMPERTFVDVEQHGPSMICGVTVEGELWCWDDRSKESWQVPLPMAAATSD